METFQGREHLVVPIIALVEGVIQGANAEHAELALASEFGKHIDGWNGRPVTLGHPKVDGNFVSVSSSPQVFEREALGFLFNSVMMDKKLKVEAWIDMDKVRASSKEVQKEIKRLQDKQVTEVSTGLFTAVEATEGKFNEANYNGVWRSVVPDHLAILHEGVTGACSVKDGCGAHRTNEKIKTNCGCEDKSKPEKGLMSLLNKFLGRNSVDTVDFDKLEIVSKASINKEDKMDKDALIESLITNEAVAFEEKDREWLKLQSEEKLKKLLPAAAPVKTQAELDAEAAKAKADKEAADKEAADKALSANKKPVTAAEYLAEAPAEIKEVLQSGLQMHTARRDHIVKALKSNKRNKFSEEALKAMSLADLENLATLADVPSFERPLSTISANAEGDAPAAMPKTFA